MKFNSSAWYVLTAALLVSSATGCSSQATSETAAHPVDVATQRGGPGPSVEAEIGALDPDLVDAVFRKAQSELMGCFESGSKRLPFLAGHVKIGVVVNATGGVHSAHMKASSLGDRDTENCMLQALRKREWPRPQGGRQGLADTEFTFDAPSDVRAPIDWDPGDAGKAVPEAREALSRCKRSSGAPALSATLYVKTDGSVLSLGLGGADAATEEAASCVVDSLRGIKFNSPGSYAAKLVLSD